jgi:hypothetical protein
VEDVDRGGYACMQVGDTQKNLCTFLLMLLWIKNCSKIKIKKETYNSVYITQRETEIPSWTWAGLETCFGQQEVTEVMLYQSKA